jgi:hypothetical protein
LALAILVLLNAQGGVKFNALTGYCCRDIGEETRKQIVHVWKACADVERQVP